MPVTFRPVFESKIVRCPANPREEHQCVGRFVIWAYLIVDGTVTVPTADPRVFDTYRITGKILPQKAIVPFLVDFSDTIGTSDTVKTCMEPGSQPAGGPTLYLVNEQLGLGVVASLRIESVGAPTTTARDQGDCVAGKAKFAWQCGVVTVQAAINAAMITSALPLAGNVSAGAGGSFGAAAGGVPVPPLEVVYEICSRDGCQKQTITDDTATDGEAVFNAPPANLTMTKVP